MRILVIGGSGFMGPHLIRELLEGGHDVTLLHRGNARPELPAAVKRMAGDRNRLAEYRGELERRGFDVVVDMVLSDERQARQMMDVFRGIAGRVLVVSSGDVYRAYAVLLGNEPGPPQETPLTEDSELRGGRPYGEAHLRFAQTVFSWLTDHYDKVPVERVAMSDPQLPGTVLRLPMVYGPGDPLHRLFPIVKRVDDGRAAILVQQDTARLRPPRGFVEDVAGAIALAAVAGQAVGRVYNVAEGDSPSEAAWTGMVARAAGWNGRVVALPKDGMPKHLQSPLNAAQDWLMSSQRIRRELGYRERIPRETALQRTIAWERAHPPAHVDPALFDYAAEDAAVAGTLSSRAVSTEG
jgi:nucleoside-diphosphate-sugar epimerase